MIFGAILAGGSGTRMQAAMPKQFLIIGDAPVLIHTLRAFLACDEIDHVLVGIPAVWMDYTRELIATHCPGAEVTLFSGGATRTDTLFAAADTAQRTFGASPSDLLITHDAVRPFVTRQMLLNNIAAAMEDEACGTAIPATDTILESDDGKYIAAIPPRTRMYQMQTPQTFNIAALRESFASLTPAQREILTDGCGIFTACGRNVRIVMGSTKNIKITTPPDLATANAFLAAEK